MLEGLSGPIESVIENYVGPSEDKIMRIARLWKIVSVVSLTARIIINYVACNMLHQFQMEVLTAREYTEAVRVRSNAGMSHGSCHHPMVLLVSSLNNYIQMRRSLRLAVHILTTVGGLTGKYADEARLLARQ